ncbi:MAG: hypothetical protein A3F68_04500 [Acidobacteria bacterium RIFCSPLOWO2_12_FULL_54_10]|nr:MAG: hypothetical protein A3F68_04500 [Acidobacteria bacterium RIFCSPLOWO2_12_FULL_54_10]
MDRMTMWEMATMWEHRTTSFLAAFLTLKIGNCRSKSQWKWLRNSFLLNILQQMIASQKKHWEV